MEAKLPSLDAQKTGREKKKKKKRDLWTLTPHKFANAKKKKKKKKKPVSYLYSTKLRTLTLPKLDVKTSNPLTHTTGSQVARIKFSQLTT